jgi:predicted sulfurtransferase
MEEVVPPLVDFTKLLEKHATLMFEARTELEGATNEFITQELLKISKFQDFTDEVGRRAFLAYISKIVIYAEPFNITNIGFLHV